MANQFVDLPTTAHNGPGAWVDVSTFGALKTITVTNASDTPPFITVECSNEDAPTTGYTLPTFTKAKEQTFGVACHWMRAVTSNYSAGAAAVCAVGGTDDGASSLELVVPASNGNGAPVDVSGLPNFKTVAVTGVFGGTLLVSVSEDGGVTYSQVFSFQGGVPAAFQTELIAADFMRVQRVGVPIAGGGTPVVWVSASIPPTGGGGGGSAITVDQDGTPVVTPATTLNFTGAVTVTDDGGGVATIDVTGGGGGGIGVDQNGTQIVDPATVINFTGTGVTVTDAGSGVATVNIPGAGTDPNIVILPADVASGFIPGQCGYVNPSLSQRFTASGNNDTEQDAQVAGLCSQAQTGTTQHVRVAGPLTLTAPQWAAIIAEGGSLVEGLYYLADYGVGDGGAITAVKPTASGSFVTVVGYAVTALTLIVRPEAAQLIP